MIGRELLQFADVGLCLAEVVLLEVRFHRGDLVGNGFGELRLHRGRRGRSLRRSGGGPELQGDQTDRAQADRAGGAGDEGFPARGCAALSGLEPRLSGSGNPGRFRKRVAHDWSVIR